MNHRAQPRARVRRRGAAVEPPNPDMPPAVAPTHGVTRGQPNTSDTNKLRRPSRAGAGAPVVSRGKPAAPFDAFAAAKSRRAAALPIGAASFLNPKPSHVARSSPDGKLARDGGLGGDDDDVVARASLLPRAAMSVEPATSISASGDENQVFLIELGLIAMGIVDTLQVGHVSDTALAAASLGGTMTWLVVVTMNGLVGALDPLTSQAHGANDFDAVKKHLRSGVRAGCFLAACAACAQFMAHPLFTLCGLPPLHAAAAAGYCQIEAWGMLPVVLFQTFRLSLSGTNLFAPLVYAIVLSNVANVAMNDVLIFGSEGVLGSMLTPFLGGGVIPAMGLDGAAWATTASRWILLASLLLFARKPLAKRDAFRGPLHRRGDVASAATLMRQGLPIGGQMLLEFGAFATMQIFAGRCGTTEAAGHAIIQCLTDISYVLPLALGALGAVQVGQNVGAGDQDGTNSAARVAIVRGAIAVGINAIIFLALGRNICWWFTDDAAVHAVAVAILPVIAVYQAADGLRVVGGGCLRGVGMLREMIAADFIGFWCLGIPCGAWLCLGTTWKVYGLWWGFAFGVVVVLWPILRLAWRVGEDKPVERFDGGAVGPRAA